MKRHCYFNGKTITVGEIRLSPYDIGLLRGYGVFDVMCTQNGKPFLLDEHWKRLQNSAKELNLRIPVSKEKYKKTIKNLLKLNNFSRSVIRTVLTGGESCDGFSPCGNETFFILIEKFQALPKDFLENGVGVVTLNFQREIPRAKVTNYVHAIRNLGNKNRNKALETTYVSNGEVLENSMSNIMIFSGDTLVIPRDGILLGITRNLVAQLAKKKFKVEERRVSEKEFRQASEVFLTGSLKDVVPVVKIDGKKVGDGKVGKNTKIIMELFQAFAKKY
jgi:branched-chain amino acid aminotransferase